MGVDKNALLSDLAGELNKNPRRHGLGGDSLYASRRLSALLVAAEDGTKRFGDSYPVEHLYLALLGDGERRPQAVFGLRHHTEKFLAALRRCERTSAPRRRTRRDVRRAEKVRHGPRRTAGKVSPTVIGRDQEIPESGDNPVPQDEKQHRAHRRAGRRQDAVVEGLAHASGAATSRNAQGQDDLRSRHGFAHCGREVPRRV